MVKIKDDGFQMVKAGKKSAQVWLGDKATEILDQAFSAKQLGICQLSRFFLVCGNTENGTYNNLFIFESISLGDQLLGMVQVGETHSYFLQINYQNLLHSKILLKHG